MEYYVVGELAKDLDKNEARMFFERFLNGDLGEIDDELMQENLQALKEGYGDYVMGKYNFGDKKITIIMEDLDGDMEYDRLTAKY